MRYVPRAVQPTLEAAARRFPAVILTGTLSLRDEKRDPTCASG
jgi:hypothetical protein